MNRNGRFLLSLALSLVAGASQAQTNDSMVVQMTGDRNAVWIATRDNRLIYCWWPQDPARPDKQASCRTLDRFKVDRL